MRMEEQENIVYEIRRRVNSNIGLKFFTRRVINYIGTNSQMKYLVANP